MTLFRFTRVWAVVVVGLAWFTFPGVAHASSPRLCGGGQRCDISRVPNGPTSRTEPSGEAPLGSHALRGYHRVFVDDFNGSGLSRAWSTFAGQPGSDPGAQWSPSHVHSGGGVLTLGAWRDPSFNNQWVTGGLCVCQETQTYGAYFVRARLSGPGATFVGLLWPTVGWPPEIDFTETYGPVSRSMATVHFGSSNQQLHSEVRVSMTAWHTWGVIWTPHSITYTLDGVTWGRVSDPAAIPDVPMSLHLQQQTWCALGYACPQSPVTTSVDWVEIFQSNHQHP
ncbi:MAG: glycoside hydrolase family 16 protein [Acidimicrobiaceae bacterium]|nr:glycoside hydrolase family 16 protein [Acidimicrobiaceae bacterium]